MCIQLPLLPDRGDLKAILWHLTKSEIKSASGVYYMGVTQVKSSLFAALLFSLYMIDTMSGAGYEEVGGNDVN